MPFPRIAPLRNITVRPSPLKRLRARTARVWTRYAQPFGRMLRDMLVAPLSLLTVQFLQGTGWYPSKFASLSLVAGVTGAAIWAAVDPVFYIQPATLRVTVQSPYEIAGVAAHLAPDAIGGFQDVLGHHVLWQVPRQIRQAVLANPFLAAAETEVRFPAQVAITVQEVAPTLLWVTDNSVYAVLANGKARRLAVSSADRARSAPTFLTLFDWNANAALNRAPRHAVTALHLDPDLLNAILTLQREYQIRPSAAAPALHAFYFSKAHGLYFHTPGRRTRVFWGDGLHLPHKLANLRGIEEYAAALGRDAELIDVRPISKPYFR